MTIRIEAAGLAYGKVRALDGVTLELPEGTTIGLIGPDGVGKSSLLSLIAGARAIQTGRVEVLGGSMADAGHRRRIGPRIAYMPQGLGRNLYATLSVRENVDFFGRLFGHGHEERRRRIDGLLAATGLSAFADRPAGKLSGGMKQKLGLCCALIHDPDLLILDEPTTGVDPLSRRQFWDLIAAIREARPGMTVLVATAYMEEAARFDHLVAMYAGRVLDTGSPAELLARTGCATLDEAFIALLPAEIRADHRRVEIPPRAAATDVAIEAEGLTMRFGGFTAVDHVSFRIQRGEIFGFLGSNGCGKTTTMKMLTGLLAPTEGQARLFGQPLDAGDMATRARVGYMSQSFSLYSELTVRQNLDLHARLFGMEPSAIPPRIDAMARRFSLLGLMDSLPDALPLGIRQRLSLATAMIHGPEILILDEPTSGVDPVARDTFWQLLAELSRKDGVTIFVSTHFMNEAELCDRISLMHAGRVLVSDRAEAIRDAEGAATLEDAFIALLSRASDPGEPESAGTAPIAAQPKAPERLRLFDFGRIYSYSLREALELRRDPIRAALAMVGSLILMFVMGYGVNMDVEELTFAALDRDRSGTSQGYLLDLEGSRYFREAPPILDDADMERRMKTGELTLAIEIPPGFGRDIDRGDKPEVGAWIDGAMPSRAQTVAGYVQGMHAAWLTGRVRETLGDAAAEGSYSLQTRYRYNPDLKSLNAMVPAIIPLLLLMIPAMLTALSVVREKELGSITNLYVTPVTRLEFLIGKQLPYVALAMFNFALMVLAAVTIFGVPFTGSLVTLTLAALLYVTATTALGLVVSSFMQSQIAAIFGTALITVIPGVQFCGLLQPVSSLEGFGALVGRIYPTSHFVTIARGTFSKALGFADLHQAMLALVVAAPVLMALGAVLLRRQAR